ncbi:hypothetical protein QFC22_006097 [Naganishia vaughanmartiniae]|uniref:Uncharacterized protein n=1 Tax=Naganishia vaughanmartiniae TaxID=1424756 RepID=A0ACC2WNG5_9TREE|nr:hypothetical protein QFC22_006097 [Naganishia vaughanmartiniae]
MQARTKITNAPRYLMINLGRTEERQLGDPSSKGVKIHKELDLSEYAEGEIKLEYRLVSTVQHHACDQNSGHYMTDIAIGSGCKRFDDHTVTTVQEPWKNTAFRTKKVDNTRVWQDSPVILVYESKFMKGEGSSPSKKTHHHGNIVRASSANVSSADQGITGCYSLPGVHSRVASALYTRAAQSSARATREF